MSESDRIGAIAFGLAIAFCAVFLIGLWAGIGTRDYGKPEGEYYKQGYTSPDKDASGGAIAGKPEPNEAICANPQSHDDADLCSQWRAANAARDANVIAAWQLGFGVVGVVGLAVTIYFAWKAWREAKRGADAAVRANHFNARTAAAASDAVGHAFEANRIQERAIATDQRPWLTLRLRKNIAAEVDGSIMKIEVKYRLKNLGKTPAIGVRLFGKIYELKRISDSKALLVEFIQTELEPRLTTDPYDLFVAPGQRLDLNQPLIAESGNLERFQLEDGRENCITVAVCGVAYKSLVDDEIRCTARAYIINHTRTIPGTSIPVQPSTSFIAEVMGANYLT